MIIDSHVHLGKSLWGDFSPKYLLDILGEEIDFAICSNLEGIDSPVFKNEEICNLEMLEVSKLHTKLKPLYVCQPNITSNTDIARLILNKHQNFIGLKFHPECMKLPADNKKYDDYLKIAQELKKPCLYHSGHIKSRFSSPKLIYQKAQEFPDIPIILGHLSRAMKRLGKALPAKATRRNISIFSHTILVCITAHITFTLMPPKLRRLLFCTCSFSSISRT